MAFAQHCQSVNLHPRVLEDMRVGDNGLVSLAQLGDRFHYQDKTVKTIGDARQLCRLLGVPLKE